MRPRISPAVEQAVHTYALGRGINDHEALTRILDAGLRATKQPRAAISGPMTDAEIAALPQALRSTLRKIAEEHEPNQRRMLASIISTGLRAMGADAAVVAELV